MSRFVQIPDQGEDTAFFVNTDHVVTVLLDKTTVYITLKLGFTAGTTMPPNLSIHDRLVRFALSMSAITDTMLEV